MYKNKIRILATACVLLSIFVSCGTSDTPKKTEPSSLSRESLDNQETVSSSASDQGSETETIPTQTTGENDTIESEPSTDPTDPAEPTELPSASDTPSESEQASQTQSDEPTDPLLPPETLVVFSETGITLNGAGANAKENTVTITESGTYRLSGTSANASVRVNLTQPSGVTLILDNLNLTSASSFPLIIEQAGETQLVLADGTVNTLSDVAGATDQNIEINATLYSQDDLTISGNGSLTVNGRTNNAITVKNDLKIKSGTITVNAANHGLRGNDSVRISGGTVTISALKDGIKSANSTNDNDGYIEITAGRVSIIAGDDALQAVKGIYLRGGYVKVNAGGKRTNCDVVEISSECRYVR